MQIRLFKRHEEFRRHFDNLYISLREKKPDHIVLAGDLLHNKSALSPEQLNVFIDFLKNLADIAPLHLIAGNHDTVLNNLTRLDSISPIIKALDNESIKYYKHSGVYPVDDKFDFVVFSCLDDELSWPKEENTNKSKINIGLYHGFVQGALLQNGAIIEDCPYRLQDFFTKVDYLMLGDIHKTQYLDKDKRAAYCGSILQQNYGEDLEHGYLFWEITSKKRHDVNFVKLPKICPYYTLTLGNDLSIPDNLNYQQKARIRIFSRQLNVFEKKTITDQITAKFDPVELLFMDDANIHRQDLKLTSLDEKLENLGNLDIQDKLLRNYLIRYNLSEEVVEKVLELNKTYNLKIREKDDTFRNIQYKLGKMTFHNTFSYGENNEFDFSKYKGIVGIFGKNASGKSSVAVDIPLYTIFNRISKDGVVKNDLIINENKEDCASEIEIIVGKEKHIITRATHVYTKSGKKEGEPVIQGKTDVSYKIIYENGTEEDHTAEKRQDTDQVIRSKFGTIEDFISTSMAPQWQLLGIINAGATERLKLIGRYFDIDIFAQKHKMANEDWKGIKGQIKLYESINFEEKLSETTREIQHQQELVEKFQNQRQQADLSIKELEKKIVELRSNVVRVQVSKLSESQIDVAISAKKLDIEKWQKQIEESQRLSKKKQEIDIDSLTEQRDKWAKVNECESLASVLELGCGCKHQENCENHIKIKDFRKKAELLKSDLHIPQSQVLKQICDWNDIRPKDITGLLQAASADKKELSLLERQKEDLQTNKEQLIKNRELEKQLEEIVSQRDGSLRIRKIAEDQYVYHFGELQRLKAVLAEIKENKLTYESIRTQYDVYHYFLSAMSKDGIAKQIIADNLSIINQEIKKILSKGAGFNIEIESDDDGKAIEIYFSHERSKKRKIELTSGMEKTLSAIALRAALINVTTLPRSNVFVLDEVFTALDPEYMDAVGRMLEYLKQIFDSVIIITHIEGFKDLVDKVVEVERDNDGFSKISE